MAVIWLSCLRSVDKIPWTPWKASVLGIKSEFQQELGLFFNLCVLLFWCLSHHFSLCRTNYVGSKSLCWIVRWQKLAFSGKLVCSLMNLGTGTPSNWAKKKFTFLVPSSISDTLFLLESYNFEGWRSTELFSGQPLFQKSTFEIFLWLSFSIAFVLGLIG